jgi:membrane protein YdbS with pleckstrin-like domain
MFSKADIEKYFLAEKSLSTVFMILGAIAIVVAIVFFFVMKTGFYKGGAIPFILIGVFQLYMGYSAYSRADEQRKSAVYAYDMNPAELKEKELPKMETVVKRMTVFIVIEAILLLAGIILFLYFKKDASQVFWAGLGMALAIEALLCLGVEISVKTKTADYVKGLSAFTKHQ